MRSLHRRGEVISPLRCANSPSVSCQGVTHIGLSLVGVRCFSSVAQGFVVVLVGLMARELGGKRRAQIIAAVAAAIAPVSLDSGALLQYVAAALDLASVLAALQVLWISDHSLTPLSPLL